MAMTLEELQILITAENRELKKDLKGVQQQIQKFEADTEKRTSRIGGAFKRMAAIAVAALATISFKNAKDDAMQYEASLGQINRLLKDQASAFEQWAITQGKAFGMSRLEAVKYGATYSNLLSGFTTGTEQLTTRTQDLLQASAVVASATGRTVDDVMERIRSGLLGNTEAIEDLGINVNVALIESTAAFKKFANGKSWQQLDFNAQQTIRYYAIMEQAAKKYGNELAQNTNTRQGIFVSYLKDARLYLGQAFLPIYNAVLPALTAMAKALASATQWLATFTQAVFGKVNTAPIADQSNAVGELGDSYEKAGKQAQKSVAGFDQVNLVGGTSKGAASGGDAGIGGLSQSLINTIGETNSVTDKLIDDMRKNLLNMISEEDKEVIKGRIADIDDSFASLKDTIGSLKGNENFQNFIDEIKQWSFDQLVGKTAGAMQFLNGNIKVFDGFMKILDGAFDGDFEKTWDGGEKVLSGFNEVLISMTSWYFPNFAKKWEDTTNKISNRWKSLKENIKKYGDPTKLELSDFANFVSDRLRKGFSEAVAGSVSKLVELRNKSNAKWQEIKDKTQIAIDLTKAIVTKAFSSMVSTGVSKLNELKTGISTKWTEIKTNAATKLGEVISTIYKKWDDLKTGTSTRWDAIKTTVSTKWNLIKGINWDSIKSGISNTWDSIKTTADTKWGGVVTVVKNNVNKIIEYINKMIRGVNKFSIDVPDWMGKIPGVPDDIKSIGFNIPEIPKLAVGTNYVAQDGLAYLHEGEAVVPKKYNPAAGGGDNAALIAEIKALRADVRGIKQVKAVIGRDEVGRATTGYINDEYRRGNNPLPSM